MTSWVHIIILCIVAMSVGYFLFKLYFTMVFVPKLCSNIAIDAGRGKTDVFDIV